MCSVCDDFDQRLTAGNVNLSLGAVAQLEERLHGMEKVARSTRVSSTNVVQAFILSWVYAGSFFGGLIAGEGSFLQLRCGDRFTDGTPRKRFVFSITMAAWDDALLVALRSFLGVGGLRRQPATKPSWQPTATLRVQSHVANRRTIIPFAERFLPPSRKREQFDEWRDSFFAYERAHPTRWGQGPSMCSVPGCEKPVRGRGLCRSHYYRATGY